jgi:hypothetical protein
MNDLLKKEQSVILQSQTPISNNGKQPLYKNKLKLALIIGIPLLIIAIVIIIVVAIGGGGTECTTCDCNKDFCDNNNDDDNQNVIRDKDENDSLIINIEHKKGEVSIYNDVISKTSTVVVEKNNVGTGRRLEEKSYTTTFNGKYLLNVYNVNNNVNPTVYEAYAVLLSLTNNTNGKTNNLGGSDIRNSNDDFPFIKFSFDSNGKIDKLYAPKNYDKVLTAYIYEFIEKVVPKLDKSSYGRRLQGQPELSFNKNGNKTHLNKGEKKRV